jgi:hypothetical protein
MLVAKTTSTRPVHGGEEAQTDTLYEDFRAVAGVLFPFRSREIAKGGQHNELFQWETMEANVPLDDSWFQIPSA